MAKRNRVHMSEAEAEANRQNLISRLDQDGLDKGKGHIKYKPKPGDEDDRLFDEYGETLLGLFEGRRRD